MKVYCKNCGDENDIGNEALKLVIEYHTTYIVLKEIFEKDYPMQWNVLKGAFLLTPEKSKEFIENITGQKIEEVIK